MIATETGKKSTVSLSLPPESASSKAPESGKFTRKIKVAQFGLGMIGLESLRLLANKEWAEIVGAIDIDPDKVGKRLTQLVSTVPQQATVFGSFDELWAKHQPDVVIHTAGSKIKSTLDQIEPMVRNGVSVVSSCEELLFPQLRAPELADAIDRLCRTTGARVVGTGVNPGFVMDVVPVCMTGVSRTVKSIYVERVVNASTRRMMLQKKIGSGMDPAAFRQLFAEGKAGHAGFQESAALIAHAMGWKIDRIKETCEPVVAKNAIKTNFFSVNAGETCGLHQRCIVHSGGKTLIEMDLKMYLDANDPHDLVRIEGEPPIEVRFNGGVAGDDATVAAIVNAAKRILKAQPGMLLMTDLAVPSWC